MAAAKWIGGFLGFITTGSVLGAIAGYALGSLFDKSDESPNTHEHFDYAGDTRYTSTKRTSPNSRVTEGQQNSFRFCLMVMAAHVIQADGKIMHSEMEMVRKFLRKSFGEDAVQQGNEILLSLFEFRKQEGEAYWNEQIREACREINHSMPEAHRLQLVAFLAEIIKADGIVTESEIEALRLIASLLSLYGDVVSQLLSLGGNTLEDAYRVLGIKPEATDDEVRRAYKRMVVENHPDRVAALGEDVRKAATEKLQEINNAKEIIFKHRNM